MSALRIASINVNGIRAAYRKGMPAWLEPRGVDILALQEVRASRAQVDALLDEAGPSDWNVVLDEATAAGRAGVAIASHRPILEHRAGIGPADFDSAGRWIEADFDIDGTPLTVVSCYVHSGEVDTPKQEEKWRFLDAMAERMRELRAEREHVLVVGDFNVGHTTLDIKNWKGNVKRAGFLPRERGYFDRLFGEYDADVEAVDGSGGKGLGWIDVGRRFAGEVDGPYSWWSWRGKAFDNDTGWRIDYHAATPALAERVEDYTIDRAAAYDQRWSDHAPVVADYRF
ncbi:MAG: exodeoxyribonuclease III [Microbacteriaceae bacterium]|nr:exodeoxyribonuclease III [Microbacteriaceae bacterium]